jgi:hypothetical protein
VQPAPRHCTGKEMGRRFLPFSSPTLMLSYMVTRYLKEKQTTYQFSQSSGARMTMPIDLFEFRPFGSYKYLDLTRLG